MNILLTGGTGYIGSHTALVLAQEGHQVVLFDNLCNSQESVVERLKIILGANAHGKLCSGGAIQFIKGDIRCADHLIEVLQTHSIEAIVHFAGFKAVGASVDQPFDYFDNNVGGTLSLIKAMQVAQVSTLVFSSSATVYGNPQYLPLDETHPTSATNPYGRTKLHIEEMLADIAQSDSKWRIVCLRYFNPVGAHCSGLIGEDPSGVPNNLMPYLAQVADNSLPILNVFGSDYPTPDGTGIRDYIHVMDLAEGHLAALTYLHSQAGWHAFNVGTGQGSSVLEMIKGFEVACGKRLPYQTVPRRPGDVAVCYANADKAAAQLGWRAKRTLDDICASTWHFQKKLASVRRQQGSYDLSTPLAN